MAELKLSFQVDDNFDNYIEILKQLENQISEVHKTIEKIREYKIKVELIPKNNE
jgi:predicted ribosome quality control (RQC) complex YloA/Tae2 family protein